MEKTKVILADDHGILRYGLQMFLSRTDDIEIVGEASSGAECLRLFEEMHPDVCLIDIEMPHKNGIEVVQSIRQKNKSVKLLILSMHENKSIMQKAFDAGADGYLMKDTPKKEIVDVIRKMINGQKISNGSAKAEMYIDTDETDGLTSRELEILQLVVNGLSSPQIAEQLFISPRTVDTHRNNIMKKLDMKNTASLVRYALQHNLVDSDPVNGSVF